jgi:Ca-activated chloride channel family protein
MKMLINFLMCFIFFISFSLYPLSYDSAAYAAQGGKWNDAYAQLNAILVDSPDRADVLYDAGVAAYNLEHWDQAVACFSRAAEYAEDKDLRFRSHFNAGNALVAQKNLQAALEQYEKALALDPADEYARHNYDRVKEMLEQQKQEQQQQNNDQQQDDQKKDQEKDQEKKEQEEKNQDQNKQNQSNNNKNDQQNNDQKQDQQNNSSDNDSSENELNKQSDGNEGDKAQNGGKDTQRKDHRNNEKNQKQSANNQQRDGNHQPEEQPHNKNSKRDTKHGDKHKKTPEKQSNNSDNTSVASHDDQKQDDLSAAEAMAGESPLNTLAQSDPWLLAVLENQEASDKATNKKLMGAKIHQHGGKNDQNCW